jgi:hypothetical protein
VQEQKLLLLKSKNLHDAHKSAAAAACFSMNTSLQLEKTKGQQRENSNLLKLKVHSMDSACEMARC